MISKLIIALGNPGDKYKLSRHNAAWLVIDQILANETWNNDKRFKALICKKNDILIVKPLTYMNLSGHSVISALSYYKLLPKKLKFFTKKNSDLSDVLTVIHDDLDINLGEFKISVNKNSGGHKGVSSIIEKVATKNFNRIRLGIKTDSLKNIIPADKFVMQNFKKTELNELLKNTDLIEKSCLK